MDPEEKRNGLDEQLFWHRAKLGLIDILLSKLKRKDLDTLIIGCGTGNDLQIISKYSKRLTVCDVNQKALDSISEKVVKKKTDATKLDFKDSSFDVVLSFDVFEHVRNDAAAIKESFRVLRKGGYLIFTVPAFKLIFSSYDSFYKHYRRYNKKELLKKLTSFRPLFLSYWNSFLFIPFFFERMIKKHKKYAPSRNMINGFLNSLFFRILSIENYLIKKNIRLPFGLTLCGIFTK